jgi:uncharacterized protein YqeY
MKLVEQIRADRIVAFKAKHNIKKNLLGCLIADACKEDKEPEDQKVLAVIKKFIENAQFVCEKCDEKEYEFYQATQEIEILEAYRPAQMSEEELRVVISKYLDETKNFKMGDVMKHLKQDYEGTYDGKLASHLLKNIYGLK